MAVYHVIRSNVAGMSEAEAHALLAQAEKAATTRGWFSSPKHSQAAELYAKAANIFKLTKNLHAAGDALTQSAAQHIMAGDRDDAAPAFANAAKCYRKGHPQDAISALRQSIEILTDAGRFHQAAGQMKTVAEIYESDLVDLPQAMKSYETAAEWYETEESASLASACWLKVATFAAQLEHYDRAISIFELVAQDALSSQLTRYSVKEYLFKAALCQLCTGDSVSVQRALQRYADLDPSFQTTREFAFIKALTEAVDAGDVDAFTGEVIKFDDLSKLDPWKTTLLLRVKRAIGEEPALT